MKERLIKTMHIFSQEEIDKIVEYLKSGNPLPEDYKAILFENKKEYELIYDGKEREEDILADTMAVPLQPVKTFFNGGNKDWGNMLIFGDNLQVLKTLLQMKHEGKLKNADGTDGVRLVYIDPPFATRQEFRGSQEQKAYQDKIAGAKFLEFLRKRLIFLRELLSDDGSIYVHLDWKKNSYIRVLMDEIFGETKFRNEIIWKYFGPTSTEKNFPRKHDNILFYTKTDDYFFNGKATLIQYDSKAIRRYDKIDDNGQRYKLYYDDNGVVRKAYLKEGKPTEIFEIPFVQGTAEERIGYPTQKPEALLYRLIEASSSPGDLVLDCFAGSGTTLAVAEKLDRRWIGVDCGKLAIYTMQKRLLNIEKSKDLDNPKRKYGKPCKPFTLYNAGLYDYKMIKELPWEQYRDFALKLFQCRDEKHEISAIELDGYLGMDHVLVFNYQKHRDALLGKEFIDDLHKYLGDKIGKRFFIIAPAASVQFLEDYIEKGRTKYFILRIPYSIIDEIHKRGFTRIIQPMSEEDVNDTVEAVGFDFIQIPYVECEYLIKSKTGQMSFNESAKECVIKINRFESKVISKKPVKFDNMETLSMIMLDYDYNGEVFDFDEVFYADKLIKNNYEICFDENRVKRQLMIIYIDIFGNEKRETKTLENFVAEAEG